MTDQQHEPESVEQRHFDHAFDELAERASPPDRAERILARVAAGPERATPTGSSASAYRMLVAAVLLLGLGVTVLAWRLNRADSGGDAPPGDREVAQAPDGVGGPNGVDGPLRPAGGDPGGSNPGGNNPDGRELPKGTDPADLAAMRSAEAMLAAEKKLQEMIANGKIAGVDRVLPFDELSGWKYTEGLIGAPDAVRALDGLQVLMLGFMLPLDEVEDMREFLLVSSLWSCCYGTPPDVHGIVRCRMAEGRRVDYQFEPIKLVGRLSVKETHIDGYCVDIYQLDVELLEVVQ
ncbi:MAG: DUF3299 domain-containing protein [Planctomycetota bacterium]